MKRRRFDAIFLVASMLTPNRYQTFDSEERFQQIVHNISCIRKFIPNAYCLLIEGSVLTDNRRLVFDEIFDETIYCGTDPNVLPFVNHPHNIGHGEHKQLEIGINHLLGNQHIRAPIVFKISARYHLNNNFQLENWNLSKYNFKQRMDETVGFVYITALYSIPYEKIEEFRQILRDSHENLTMVERTFFLVVPEISVNKMEELGVSGLLSYNRKFFSE
jgi:hypothetical protein